MKSAVLGTSISKPEVTNISKHGFWLLIGNEELFLAFKEFPWFKNATVQAILRVELQGEDHLHWPDLDVDLMIESIRHPENYPLVSNDNCCLHPNVADPRR
jgi:hypothetical protein